MSSATINVRTDSELKAQAQSILANLGLDMSTAINVYLNQIVKKQAIPFEISSPLPAPNQVKFGGWEGKIFMSDDFNGPMEEFEEYM
jgi:DNA-damage-inducible protein J